MVREKERFTDFAIITAIPLLFTGKNSNHKQKAGRAFRKSSGSDYVAYFK